MIKGTLLDFNLTSLKLVLCRISILFYPTTLEGRRGTTDEFATIPFHLVLFSAVLAELAKSIPVHSLILSSHLFFCLPLFLFPSKIVYSLNPLYTNCNMRSDIKIMIQ